MASLPDMLQSAYEKRVEAAKAAGDRFTTVELSRLTGVERSTLSRIMSGKLRGSPASLYAIARELDLDPGEVLRAAAELEPEGRNTGEAA